MRNARAARLGRVGEWILLAVFAIFFVAHTVPNAWRSLNTDFPNYYLTAQLAREGYDISQAYDWRWLQREKDHRAIDQRIIGLAPITPFSTLFVWPLTSIPALQAKRGWIILQLGLLGLVALMLRRLTRQPLRRIALLAVACFPLHRNLLYGQFYILLLAMLVAACWAYRRKLSILAGVLIGVAAMTKIFPAIFLLYFVRKHDWRALAAAGVTLFACTGLSVGVFGWGMHRHYLEVVLPWTLRGEPLPPYLLAASSFSSLLHRLFVYEPQWNPHPWHNAPIFAAVLAPVLQLMVIAPVVLLIGSGRDGAGERTILLEWSALLCATLAISTIPASYNFTLLLFPMVVLCSELTQKWPALAAVAALLYLAIGYPAWNTRDVDGVRALLHEPRLFFLLAFTLLCGLMLRQHMHGARFWGGENASWCGGLLIATGLSVAMAVRHQRNLYDDYEFRLPMRTDVLLSADPAASKRGIEAVSLLREGYRLMPGVHSSSPLIGNVDQLSFAASTGGDWVEEAGISSRIVSSETLSAIDDARSPVLSADGRLVAYIRDRQGRGQLLSVSAGPLTSADWNVLDAAPWPDGTFVVAASEREEMPALFRIDANHVAHRLGLGIARYPSPSPDGRWLAYSGYRSGSWNLWLMDLAAHTTRRLGEADCNQVEPSWEGDSKTLLYASDCGRALGFTALCRRRVVP